MATADDSPPTLITVTDDQCGYCLESGTRRADPRQLPCGHSFCLVCLKTDYERIKAVRCPVCRKFVSVKCNLDNLPMSGGEETESYSDSDRYCDSCSRASPSVRRPGIKHCSQCQCTFCDTHEKVHSGLFSYHKTATITEWEALRPVRESMMCRDHSKYPVTTGCKVCHGIYCNVCCLNEQHKTCPASPRDDGHEFDVLENLVQKAREEVQETLTTLQQKKDELSKAEKELSKMMEVLDESKETTLEEMKTAREKHIKEVNHKYDVMQELYLTRMIEIQVQAEGFANQVTVRQTQLDRGMQQGREIHTSVSEADVLRRRDALIPVAVELHGMTVPLFDVKNPLSLIDRAHLTSRDLAVKKELVDVPLKFFLKDRRLDLTQITVKGSPPLSLCFDHNLTSLGKVNGLWNRGYSVCFGDFGESVYWLDCQYKRLNKHSTSSQVTKDDLSLSFDIGYFRLISRGSRLIIRDNSRNSILSSMSLTSPSFPIDKTLQEYPFRNLGTPIQSFAVTSSNAILCFYHPGQQPDHKLLTWNPESGETREIVPRFTTPTKVTDMTSGPGETVLLFCKEVVVVDEEVWDFYRPAEKPKIPKDFVALVNLADGNILWMRIIEPGNNIWSPYIIYNEDFFYCLKQVATKQATYSRTTRTSIGVEIIDAKTGLTVKELGINNLPPEIQYDQLRYAHIVQRRDGSRKMMLIHNKGLSVVSISY